MPIFGTIESFLSDLYPYRVPITAAFVVLAVAATTLAVRRDVHRTIARVASQRPLLSGGVAVALLVAGAVVGDYLVSPLWERTTLNEPSPVDLAASGTVIPAPFSRTPDPTDTSSAEVLLPTDGTGPPTTEDGIPTHVVAHGEFRGADEFHFGRGAALLIEVEPGVYTLRFEDFSVRNGPDLFVYLSDVPDGYGGDVVKLGALKATDGNFNYEVPPGIDVSRFQSVIVWCDAFATLFATATFQ